MHCRIAVLSKALPLRELEMVFEGPKPAQTVDEENVPCKAPLWETTELLQAGQSVKALSLRHGSCRSCKIVEPFKDACPYIMLASQALGRGTAARLLPGPNRGIDKLPVFCKLAIPRRAGSMLRLVPARRRRTNGFQAGLCSAVPAMRGRQAAAGLVDVFPRHREGAF